MNHKFNIGDKVVVVDDSGSDNIPLGSVLTINYLERCDDNSSRGDYYKFEGRDNGLYECRLELYKEVSFPNETFTPFKDLTDEQKLLIIREKMKGNVEMFYNSSSRWALADGESVVFSYIYRTKPVVEAPKNTPLDLPWQFIKPEYKWAAMDENEEIYLFEAEPHTEIYYWYEATSACYCLSDLMNIPTKGIVWGKSLTKRGDGV